MPGWLATLRFAMAVAMFCWALLTLIEVPAGFLWLPAIAATEFGHFLLLGALALAAPGWRGCRQSAACALSLAAAVGFATPTVRAYSAAEQVKREGAAFWGNVEPQSPQSFPFSLRRLLSLVRPAAPIQRHTFDARHGLQLEVYGPFGAAPRPLVVVIHGGSWSSGDHQQLPAINHYLAHRGLAVAAITYRLAPKHTFPKQRQDVLEAIDWLKRHARQLAIDRNRIALLGRSAGGHLALLAGYTADDPAIKGVVAYYAPTDLNYAWAHPTNPLVLDTHATLAAFMGGTPDELPLRYRQASPWQFVGQRTPPTLLIHGARDELVFYEHTDRLRRRLAANGVSHLVVRLPWATHGLEANLTGPSGQISTWAVERFLAHVLSGEGGLARQRRGSGSPR